MCHRPLTAIMTQYAMTRSIRRDGEAVSPRTAPTMTPPRHSELVMPPAHSAGSLGGRDSEDATTFFRILYRPSPTLGKSNAELAFVAKRSPEAHPYDIWTRAGRRRQVSRSTWRVVYKPRSQEAQVPPALAKAVEEAWISGRDVSEVLSRFHSQWTDSVSLPRQRSEAGAVEGREQ